MTDLFVRVIVLARSGFDVIFASPARRETPFSGHMIILYALLRSVVLVSMEKRPFESRCRRHRQRLFRAGGKLRYLWVFADDVVCDMTYLLCHFAFTVGASSVPYFFSAMTATHRGISHKRSS